ncbi:hypothetical protein MMC22_003893 [Lobaria immixta]|nr:hypothetical protein [Lobaria immixta]
MLNRAPNKRPNEEEITPVRAGKRSQRNPSANQLGRNVPHEQAIADDPTDDGSSTMALEIPRPTASGISTPIEGSTGSPTSKKKKTVLNERPPVEKTWEVFGDTDSTNYLSSARTEAEYETGCRYFHARIALIAREFTVDELTQIFHATLPKFIRDGEDYARRKANKIFEDAYDWVQDKIVERLRAYAKLWLKTEGGEVYSTRFVQARTRKKPSTPYPTIPDGRCMNVYEDRPGLEWGRRQLADVFLVSFRAIETTSRQGNSHWITLDRDDRWYNGLNVVVTNLVLEVVRLIVEAETVRVSAPEKNNSAFTVQDELPRPVVTTPASTLGRAIQLRQDFQRELDRLLARTVAAHRYGSELDKELRKLDEEERSRRSAQEALGMYSDKTLQKEVLVTERCAAVAGPRVAGSADISFKPHVASPAPDSNLMSQERNSDIDMAEQRRTERDALELLDRPESMLSQ